MKTPYRITLLLTLGLAGCRSTGPMAIDEVTVRAAMERYVQAWLANDPDAVMATLTEDVVLQPHHGVEPIVEAEDVRSWWFHEGPPTVVTTFEVDVFGLSGVQDLAYAWERSEVEWTSDGASYANEGNALSVLRRGPDGSWRIAHQIWNDPPAETR